jgi:O-succinylbenzoic acid--CoA ligase
VDEVAVLGLPDAEWGQAVCACVPARISKEAIAAAIGVLEPELAPYKRPKRWIQLAEWPRDEKGKLNRSLLRMLLRPHGAEERG